MPSIFPSPLKIGRARLLSVKAFTVVFRLFSVSVVPSSADAVHVRAPLYQPVKSGDAEANWSVSLVSHFTLEEKQKAQTGLRGEAAAGGLHNES